MLTDLIVFPDGVMEIVSYIFVILLMDKIGRKAMLIACLAVAALGLLLNAIIDATATSEGAVNTSYTTELLMIMTCIDL